MEFDTSELPSYKDLNFETVCGLCLLNEPNSRDAGELHDHNYSTLLTEFGFVKFPLPRHSSGQSRTAMRVAIRQRRETPDRSSKPRVEKKLLYSVRRPGVTIQVIYQKIFF